MLFSSVYIHIRVKKNKKEKKHIASQGFSNKSKKPRKKNFNAGGNITTPSPNITPNTIRGPVFFSLFIILSINYSTNIRKKIHNSKLFLTFFLSLCTLLSMCPPTTTLKIRKIIHNSKFFTWQFVRFLIFTVYSMLLGFYWKIHNWGYGVEHDKLS